MKIAFVIQSLAPGGAEGQLALLAKGLAGKKHGVTIFTLNDGGALVDEIRKSGVNIVSLGKSGRFDLLAPLFKLFKHLRTLKPDVLHGYMPVANIMCLLSKFFLKGTAVIAGIRASNIDLAAYDPVTAWSYRLERRLIRNGDAIIANSQAGAKLYRPWVKDNTPIKAIPNGIDTNVFRPDPESKLKIRKALGIDAEANIIGLVGRLDPMKDQETFLQAAKITLSRKPGTIFMCIGSGAPAYMSKLKNLTAELGIADNVVWIERQDNVAPYYSVFDVFTLCSAFGEGFPNVVAEAMACETPCVVTDVGDSALVVGETGLVVPPETPEPLAAAWVQMLNDGKRPETGRLARRRIEINFSVNNLLQRTMEILTSIGDGRQA